ncbi:MULTISPECIES: CbtA family protein [Bradyrhizobium]|jgi:cobalt transporter subunit CbtA|uniref:CbtA family protein n=1 Tax=Bradyrhizobium TaxID=374 RepID=UPI0008415713|nr:MULTISPECIES: CbtA family protein [Bradyrhizobium]MBP2427757.1 cobalt transporter subunit CbtA [Bradyrhizobium elkanii]MCP1930474.1 cobalt transporter subunit CbtA [Bradyrhizobium elkanii]MCP1970955.1 cobalt transporter subunit CbtA [Bradyrhizobium elkanii]MCS3481267.1 cobalt transporter subunit CbtA [Bradyrhizobium elkanii]MCS3518111.1 cobalt transporter subunit CbtA [Bradyrhizobium elkanii]
MSTFRSIVFSSVIAGFIVGLIVTAVQQFGTVPLILRAEVYEKTAAHKHEAAAPPQAILVHDHADHDHAAEAWEPRDGLERNVYTAGANILTAIGFALLLCGFLAVRSGATGEEISWHEGLMWGLAGFAVFTIAPGLGLPPELPGVPTAPLLSRQIWWVTAVLATAAGLGLIVFRRSMPAAIAGVVLIMLPHLIGAPELQHVETNVPSSLSHQFVVAVTLTSLVFWSLLGSLTSAAFAYFDRPGSSARS